MAAAKAEVLPKEQWATQPVVKVPGTTWRLRMKPLSTEEKNSGCLLYYQLGQLDPTGSERATLLMMLRLLQQPIFAELRTKQQLGYVVSSGLYGSGSGDDEVSGCYIIVLSKTYAPPHVQRSIDEYMKGFSDVVAAFTPDEFSTSRTALVTRYREPDRTLAEACDRRWRPIVHEHYDWSRRFKLADAIEQVKQSDVEQLAKRLLGFPRIAVHCFGSAHMEKFGEDDGSRSTEVESWEAWRAAQATWPSGVVH